MKCWGLRILFLHGQGLNFCIIDCICLGECCVRGMQGECGHQRQKDEEVARWTTWTLSQVLLLFLGQTQLMLCIRDEQIPIFPFKSNVFKIIREGFRKNKNVHVPKMQHNTSKTFLKKYFNFLSFCPFVLLSFYPFVLLFFCPYVLLLLCPYVLFLSTIWCIL